ncbi:NAD(P)/FAD-dependent oxidoreductase [Nocardiopsis sp. L17-MgMaSL7]|uniref:NAD(P)/FAD-dependent oxidoreductase n=1 Tax=Nocardiopsis sp. L17-MgMaSL7 TaxID=1938893 RepID=UPI000D717AEF|nr:FAD-dependent oxidoreductase [Nocardiopsis sp. L17-MgMaSL7]PWV54705.1 putative NAD/FAD-binding protein [Nocardiopsis sp. L17-MgMaSL7]
MSTHHTGRRRVAVIGSGVSGLTAAYILGRHDDVTLFEADDRPGGHAHTHRVPGADGGELGVDSGFIVHNRRTYPHLLRLFDELGVATRPTEMSLSVSCEGCGLEYAGARGVRALWPSGSRRSADHVRMLLDIPRFHQAARRLVSVARRVDPGGTVVGPTLGEFADRHRFSPYFTAHFLLPLVSAVWSCPAGTALDYPARHLFGFLEHHGMLGVWGSPRWRTVEGGSHTYVERVLAGLHSVRLGTPVRALSRNGDGVRLSTDSEVLEFDAAVVATHADQALALIEHPSADEREVLGAFTYTRNHTLLHTDTSVLPSDRDTWASWNHRLTSCYPGGSPVRVSYHMNRLQGLPEGTDYVVTLNADDDVKPDRVVAAMDYAHPVFTPESVAAQGRLRSLDTPVLAFAGAHHGWGFHEDGCRSGVEAAAALGRRW